MAFPLGWQRACPLVVQQSKVAAGSLTNFPVLVTAACLPAEMVTSGGANAAQANGGDIRFTRDAGGQQQLPCQIVVWNQDAVAANAKAEIYVKVPALYGAYNVTIYAWYKPSSVQTQPSASSTYGSQAVWDSSYKLVWHAGDGSALNLADSTANANDLTNTGTVSATAGPGNIRGAASFSSTNGLLRRLTSITGLVNTAPITCECWMNPTLDSNAREVLSATKAHLSIYGDIGMEVGPSTAKLASYLGSIEYDTTATVSSGAWAHVVTVMGLQSSPTYANLARCINGLIVDRVTTVTFTPEAVAITLGGTIYYDNTAYPTINSFVGKLAEVRISNIVRSSGWLATQYNNQSSPATFIVTGAPFAPGPYAAPGGFYQ